MEFSDYYTRRDECIATLEVPTISEITRVLGEPLSDIFFKQCPEALKPLVGLTPPLNGAGDDLWTSPSDILIGKVCLKPPLTNKHIKALTHQGILEIGTGIEEKYWKEMELEKQKSLQEQEELLKFMFEKEKRDIVKTAIEEEQQVCNCIIEKLESDFEDKLQVELAALEAKMTESFDKLIEEKREEIEKEWQEKLDEAVRETISTLTENFLKDLQKQSEELTSHYESLIKKEQIKSQFTLETERTRYKDILKQLKHYLECKNIANMMYVLCMERRKCHAEREEMESLYQKEIEELREKLTETEITIRKQEIESQEKQKRLEVREQCVLEILRQFQKFINFALRASPTQAEFLLSVEQMMLFELTSAVLEAEPKKTASVLSVLVPWKTPSSASSVTQMPSLTVQDHHDCFNATDNLSEHTLTSKDALPALYYNTNMYVREDFRNMFSQGIEITKDNMLWNKDVENLMQILRSTVRSEKETAADKLSETKNGGTKKEHVDNQSKTSTVDSLRSEKRRRSSVHFSIIGGPEMKLIPNAPCNLNADADRVSFVFDAGSPRQLSVTQTGSKSSFRKSSVKYSNEALIDYLAVGKEEQRKTLIGTRNSLELLEEKFNIEPEQMRLEEGVQVNIEDEANIRTVSDTSPSVSMMEETKENMVMATNLPRDSFQKHRKVMKMHNSTASEEQLSGISSKFDNHRKVSIANKSVKPTPNQRLLDMESFNESVMDQIIHDSLHAPVSSKSSLTRCNANPSFTESKLTLARDSMIIHKEMLVNKTTSMISKLSLVRDSLELLQERHGSKVEGCTIDTKSPARKTSIIKQKDSKISMARDSLEMLKGSMLALPQRVDRPSSKLSMHRNSLELVKSLRASKDFYTSTPNTSKSDKMLSKESVEVLDGIISNSEAEGKHSSVIKLDDDGSRVVKMSHFKVVEIEKGGQQSGVSFNPEAIVLEDEGLVETGSPDRIYNGSKKSDSKSGKGKPKKKRDNFFKKPNQIKVIGDRKAKEHLQENEEFTLHRVNSLLSIFKKHPSLIKLFTTATQ